MALQLEIICWENEEPITTYPELVQTKEVVPADACVAIISLIDRLDEDFNINSNSVIDDEFWNCKPKSIMRRAKETGNADIVHRNIIPCHWPRRTTSSKVHFPSSLVTAIHTRPRTHLLDVRSLYYSSQDLRRFKHEYKQLLRAQIRERASVNSKSDGDISSRQQHDNSFWRSKVGRKWHGSTAVSGTTNRENNKENNGRVIESPEKIVDIDPLNDGNTLSSLSSIDDDSINSDSDSDISETSTVSSTSSPGIFSSVFDSAREAVSILNGRHYHHGDQYSSCCDSASKTVNTAAPQHAHRQCRSTSLHVVDTLYLY